MAKVVILNRAKESGFEYVEIKNDSACAKIALQGAHIFEYTKNSEEPILWLSEISDFEYGKPIRGGVPICWPWFGINKNKNLPQHGFARTEKWNLTDSSEIDANTTAVTLRVQDSEQTLKLWPYKFELELHVVISDRLTMELKTTNLDDKAFEITQALHTYFAVSDISHVKIKGLNKKPYFDALTCQDDIQNGDISFNQEVDRVYREIDTEILLVDEKRTVHIQNEGSSSAVVWNPWINKCKRMSAMKENAYESMICIESANAYEDVRIIKPKETHTLKATIC